MMDGYDGYAEKKQELDEDAFGAKSGSIVSAFDAFPKSKPQYVTQTDGGGKWTVTLIVISVLLALSETARWWRGAETHTFSVEQGIGHDLQVNLDIVVKMSCPDIFIDVRDAAADWIHVSRTLKKEPTLWSHWVDGKGMHKLGRDEYGRVDTGDGYVEDEGFGEEHVHDIVRLAGKRAKWAKTPRLWGKQPDSCRIFGSMTLNKVHGDLHITAKGYGYMSRTGRPDPNTLNFSHIISELSFGPFHPSLENPLDHTVNEARMPFSKFQYFLSVVPTEYSVGAGTPAQLVTNQYAVTEQSREMPHGGGVPGIFVKYDIAPLLLRVVEEREGILMFVAKIINVVSGVMVAGHWAFRLNDWIKEVLGKRRRSSGGFGVIGNKLMVQ